jgi:hypothetical protein
MFKPDLLKYSDSLYVEEKDFLKPDWKTNVFFKNSAFIILAAITQICILSACLSNPVEKVQGWYRGNTHTHARYSDKNEKNDIPEISGWYRKAGYDFLLISEHNDHLAEKKTICHDEITEDGKFLMLCGLELSNKTHVTALGIDSYIGDEESLQDGVGKIIKAGGIAILNHPMDSKVTAKDFISTTGLNHIEIFNGNRPEETTGAETLWDSILSSTDGRPVYAVAADDNHYSENKVARGWIMVRSPALTKKEIQENIRSGNFYASTGISITGYSVTDKSLSVSSKNGDVISFIGKDGKVLGTVLYPEASYYFKGDELYVRAKITSKDGKFAWTQPVFLRNSDQRQNFNE